VINCLASGLPRNTLNWILDRQELQITIGSIPQIRAEGKTIDLNNDIQMIKASILYADHAKPCSFSSSSALSVLALTDILENKRVSFLKEMRAWPMLTQEVMDSIDEIVEANACRRGCGLQCVSEMEISTTGNRTKRSLLLL
jgi:hypothetical protein